MSKKSLPKIEPTSETPQQPPFDALFLMEGKDGHCTQVLIARGFKSEEEVNAYLDTFNKTLRRSRSLKKIPFAGLRVCALGRWQGTPRNPVKAARWWMKYLVNELQSGLWVIEGRPKD